MSKSWFNECPICGLTNTHNPNCPEFQLNIRNECRCTECGNPIRNGENYYQVKDLIICSDCINDFKRIMDKDEYTYEDYLIDKYERERYDD